MNKIDFLNDLLYILLTQLDLIKINTDLKAIYSKTYLLLTFPLLLNNSFSSQSTSSLTTLKYSMCAKAIKKANGFPLLAQLSLWFSTCYVLGTVLTTSTQWYRQIDSKYLSLQFIIKEGIKLVNKTNKLWS